MQANSSKQNAIIITIDFLKIHLEKVIYSVNGIGNIWGEK